MTGGSTREGCGRFLAGCGADRLARVRAETLKSAGLSTPKIRALKALAEAVRRDGLDLAALQKASDDDVHAALTAVSGIGPWTADIFIMFCLGRADAWAAGDLALQVGVARAFDLGERLSAEEASKVAERWRPWRGVAARLIWADYANLRRSGSGDPLALKLDTPARKRTLRD